MEKISVMKVVVRFLLLLFMLLVSGAFLANGDSSQSRALTYFIPQPGSQHVKTTTSLAIREGSLLDPSTISAGIFEVNGAESGRHTGSVILSDDGQTLLFYPDEPFAYGETVGVNIDNGLTTIDGDAIAETSYQFTVIDRPLSDFPPPPTDLYTAYLDTMPAMTSGSDPLYQTYPEFTNIMTRTVTTPAQGTDDGLIFVTSMAFGFSGQLTLMIIDNEGEPVYIKLLPADNFVGDFKRQRVSGTDYLSYHIGESYGGWSDGTAYVMNDQYQVIDSWEMGNGYRTDGHEFLLLDNGHAILMSYDPIPYDFQQYGGPADGTLLDIVLQEQDAAKNVVFEWRGSEHIPIEDTQQNLNVTGLVDFLHTNAVEVDDDGNWLISNRNTSEITKINRQTGDIIWRMGGAGNQFTFTNDEGFWRQHDIRRLDSGNITLFDNGNEHDPPHSRAVEYAVNETTMTVTRVWQYPDDTSEYSAIMGDVQRLGNDNTFVGWGGQPKFAEVLPDGTLALEIALGGLSYRAYRFEWNGMPAEMPRAAIQFNGNPSSATLYASWNGATDIEEYDVYAGPTRDSLSLVTTESHTGFETTIPLTGLAINTCFFQVHPVHAEAVETPYSKILFRPDLEACRAELSQIYLPFLFQ